MLVSIHLEGCGREYSNYFLSMNLPLGEKSKFRNNPARITAVPAEVPIEHLMNIGLE
jgi:hypothetical protein